MLMGRLIAEAALLEGHNVTWLPSYGAEVRGGTAHSMVKISDEEIASPVVSSPDTCIAMNQLSADKFASSLKNKGLLIINSSLAKNKPQRKDIKIISAPLTDIAAKLGNIKVANTVALGVYLSVKKVVKSESLISVMKQFAPKGKPELLEINQKALREGLEFCHD